MSQKSLDQDAIIRRLDQLTECVQTLQADVTAIKNVVCCNVISHYSIPFSHHDKQKSFEELEVIEGSTDPKIPFNQTSQDDLILQSRISQAQAEEINGNRQDLDKRYCISKAIQKNITKLIDVLPYQTCELQDLLLQSESCLTENENDLIKKQPTRRDQIRQLIRFVKGRSFKAISKFLQFSRDYNSEVVDLIWQTYNQLMEEGVKETRCVYCRMTNAVDIKDLADYAYEKEAISDELHREMTDCTHGVGAQIKLWHQLSVMSLKDSNKNILFNSILTYLCSTPKYQQYGEELQVLGKGKFHFECRCKEYNIYKMNGCNRVESFTSSILSSSVCPASSISDLTPRQSLRSLSSNGSGSHKRRPGNPKVKDICFRPNIQRKNSKRHVGKDKRDNTSPKYIQSSKDKVIMDACAELTNKEVTNCEETNPKMFISFPTSEKCQTCVLHTKYTPLHSYISSRCESIESPNRTGDADETTLKAVHVAGDMTVVGGEANRRNAARKSWPLKPRSFFPNTEENLFENLSENLSEMASDVLAEDDETVLLVHSHADREDSPCSITLPRLSLLQNRQEKSLDNHVSESSLEATLPSDRHEMLPTFLEDVFQENERTSGTEDKICYSSLTRTNSAPTRGYDHTREDKSGVKVNTNLSTQMSSDCSIQNSSSTACFDTDIANGYSSGEFSGQEMQNTRRTYTIHTKYTSASESDISGTGTIRSCTFLRKTSNSLSDTSRDVSKERRLHFGSLGWKIRDSVRKQRSINNQLSNIKIAV